MDTIIDYRYLISHFSSWGRGLSCSTLFV